MEWCAICCVIVPSTVVKTLDHWKSFFNLDLVVFFSAWLLTIIAFKIDCGFLTINLVRFYLAWKELDYWPIVKFLLDLWLVFWRRSKVQVHRTLHPLNTDLSSWFTWRTSSVIRHTKYPPICFVIPNRPKKYHSSASYLHACMRHGWWNFGTLINHLTTGFIWLMIISAYFTIVTLHIHNQLAIVIKCVLYTLVWTMHACR